MQYDSTWPHEAGAQSLEEARLSHITADATGDGTYPSPAFYLSTDRIIIGVTKSQPQQAICKSISIPKLEHTAGIVVCCIITSA